MDDDNQDARDEAILGLARRRDPRALPVVFARLQDDAVGKLAVEAATYLADAQLLAPLLALEHWWDADPELLADAIAACRREP